MSEYYVLKCYTTPDRWGYAEVDQLPGADQGQNWLTGRRFDPPIREPLELRWSPDLEGPRKYIYDTGLPLYHRDVCAGLTTAGVDNLALYRTRIVDPRTGDVCEDYLAVNIIGLVAAADLSRSVHVSYNSASLFDTDFDSLFIEPSKACDLLMFRLAECVTGVMIHRRVKLHVEARVRDPDMIGPTFIPPEEWIG